jgi:hypothetical protein
MVAHNFGDFQNLVYAEAVKGKNSRYPFDFRSIQRRASASDPRRDTAGVPAAAVHSGPENRTRTGAAVGAPVWPRRCHPARQKTPRARR